MEYQDYYKILGVEKSADEKEIQKAFRKLARRYHPDMNPNDSSAEKRFKEINEAYEVLSDADKRAKYDQLGANYQQFQRGGGNGYNWGDGAPSGFYEQGGPDFADFFSNIFGGAANNTRGRDTYKQPIKGRDLEQPIEITLEEAFKGTERIVNRAGKKKTIRIPAGATDGTRIRVAGEGEAGYAGGQQGDLYLVVAVKSDPNFERHEDDLRTEVKVGLYAAILGGEVYIQTLSGKVKVRINPGAQTGNTIWLKERGMPKLREPGKFGDLYARVLIQVPTNLTDEERTLFEHLATLRPETP